MEIGSISQLYAPSRPIGMANSLSAINNSSVQAIAAPAKIAADTYEPGLENAMAYAAGLYAPQQTLASEAVLGIGRGQGGPSWSGSAEETGEAEDGEAGETAVSGERAADGSELTEEEQALLKELEATDREVRQHEQAHMSAGGAYAGAASYTYERGPDGQNYAVGGEVSIDVSAESDPEATIAKMRVVRSAALAPANPSGQDMSVAAQAQQQEMKAQQELSRQRAEEAAGGGEGGSPSAPGVGAAESPAGAGSETGPSETANADGFAGRVASAYATMSSPQSARHGIDLVA